MKQINELELNQYYLLSYVQGPIKDVNVVIFILEKHDNMCVGKVLSVSPPRHFYIGDNAFFYTGLNKDRCVFFLSKDEIDIYNII